MPKATPALEITTDAPPPAPRKKRGKPVATETHKVERVWTEDVVIDNKPKAPRKPTRAEQEAVESDEEEIDEIYSDLPEDLAVFLQANSGAKDVTMEVRRIDGPKMDVMPGIRAGVYLGNHRFDVENHQDDLALYYAEPGKDVRFMLRLKCAGQYVPNGTIYPVDVIGASVERKAAVGVVVPQAANVVATINHATPMPQQMQSYEPPDPMAGINQTLNLLEKFQAIGLIPKLERGKPEQVTVQQNPPPDPEVAAFSTAMKFASDKTREKLGDAIIGKIIGADISSAPEESIGHLIIREGFTFLMQVVPPLIPTGQQYLSSLAQLEQLKVHQLQMQIHQQQGGAPPASLPEQSPQPEAAPQTQEPSSAFPEEPDYDALLFGHLLTLCKKRQLNTPDVVVDDIFAFIRQGDTPSGYNGFHLSIDKFVKFDAEVILLAAASENPIAARLAKEEDVLPWLKAVQDEIRKEWSQQDEPVE